MDTKVCPHCHKEQPLAEFYKSTTWCRRCLRLNSKRYYDSEKGQKRNKRYRKSEKRRKSLEQYSISDKRKAVGRKYVVTKGKTYQEYKTDDPDFLRKKNAQATAHRAKRKGKLIPQACEFAHLGKCHGRIEMHHDDYGKPLDVRWLCTRHHSFVNRRVAVT